MRPIYKLLIFTIGLTVLNACSLSRSSTTKTLFVGPEQADCVGVVPQKCLLVKETVEDSYSFFYDGIAGFEWEEGFEYELRVTVTELEDPPADGSSLVYELIEVVSKTEVGQ